MNYSVYESADFKSHEKDIDALLAEKKAQLTEEVKELLKDGE